jgi:dephospho-CoA kinase
LKKDDFAEPDVWGLTGGIASGKSTVAGFFADEGFEIIDADKISHELTRAGGAAHDEIVKRFGTADRGELRKTVFADPAARSDLEAILHPKIRAESERRIKAAKHAIIYEATLLVETGRYRDFSGLIVVSAPQEQRLERILAREPSRSMTRELAAQILSTQLSDAEREAKATWVIHNDDSLERLREQVREITRLLRKF